MKLKTRIRRALNYWGWRLSHPAAPYERYYVHRVMSKIRSGHGHPAIGPKARPLRNESELLEFLLKHGLEPGDLTIDYGCGSLRLAPPLIDFLEPGKYWGMDLAQDFLDLGRDHLSPELDRAKRPRLVSSAMMSSSERGRKRRATSFPGMCAPRSRTTGSTPISAASSR